MALLKRVVEFVLSLAAIMFLSPVFIIIVVLIRLTSKGPAIFRQERAGKGGKPFICLKFRTMRSDADPFGASPKAGTDPRLTRIGRFLREYSLDELPQLFNILSGRMSIVGPRPLYVAQIEEWDQRQRRRLEVKPGLTGLAQVSGRGGLTREEKLELDVKYVENASFLTDCRIVAATFMQVLGRSNIYEKRYSQSEHTRGQEQAAK